MTDKVYKTWVTSDDALTFKLFEDDDEPILSVEEDRGEPVVLALDCAGIDEVIGFLKDAKTVMKKIEDGEEIETEENSDEGEEEEHGDVE